MKTQLNNSIKSHSKTLSVLTLCLIALIISLLITLIGNIDATQFMSNLLDWQTL